jgi:1,2-dihydroxy-3-keto-5-methylthiopentene dioxygenase
MVSAWFMNNNDSEDQRSERQKDPPEPLDLETLTKLTGVLYWKIDADNHAEDAVLAEIRKDRGYNYHDELVVNRDKLENYDEKLKAFYTEHHHEEEELRGVLEGQGYFDIRDAQDRWIRVHVEKGDMVLLPGGCYHRFTPGLDENCHLLRLFIGAPCSVPINRNAD